MATYKTKAIVLSYFPYKEHDRIITFYSKEYGRIDARARGIRKIESKLAGHLEPCMETELLLAQGRRWDILAGSRTMNSFLSVRSSLQKIAAAAVCIEAVKHVAKPLANDYAVYSLLANTLSNINSANTGIGDMVYRFLWQLLQYSGFAPDIGKCIVSRGRVGATGYFSFEGGGILSEAYKERDVYAQEVVMADFDALRDTSQPISATLQSIIIRFWSRVIDHMELRSWQFFLQAYELPV